MICDLILLDFFFFFTLLYVSGLYFHVGTYAAACSCW